mmetsp:Transcript_10791/g.24171  ORF Transcript_10791/g.24171 Transcript_10791/m.24171 type:complete len:204 (-) Transcript_10791:318-929(-)
MIRVVVMIIRRMITTTTRTTTTTDDWTWRNLIASLLWIGCSIASIHLRAGSVATSAMTPIFSTPCRRCRYWPWPIGWTIRVSTVRPSLSSLPACSREMVASPAMNGVRSIRDSRTVLCRRCQFWVPCPILVVMILGLRVVLMMPVVRVVRMRSQPLMYKRLPCTYRRAGTLMGDSDPCPGPRVTPGRSSAASVPCPLPDRSIC